MRKSNSEEYTSVEATVVHLTQKAALLKIDGRECWVPYSQIFEDDLVELEPGIIGDVGIKTWFYEKEIE